MSHWTPDRDEVVFLGYTRGTLDAAFRKVANPENWKFHVDVVIEATESDCAEIAAAVGFYAGGGATFERDGKTVHVRAPGYYARIGS